MTLDGFEDQVISSCAKSPVVLSISVTGSGVTWLRLRAYLVDGSFIEAFHNEVTGKSSYALIREEIRIFGADNTGGWHWHPFDAADEHVPVEREIEFLDFLRQIEKRMR
jgi:hypothetical protein